MRSILRSEIKIRDLADLASRSNDWKHSLPLLGVGFCLLVYYLTILFQGLLAFTSTIPLLDFGSLYASVFAWVHHLNPYLDYPLSLHVNLGVRGLFVPAVNLNPPISLYMFRPLVAVGPTGSVQLWTAVSLLLFCASLGLIIRANPNPALRTRILMILGMAGFWYTLQYGQIYTVLLFLTAVAWTSFKGNKLLLAGISIGLICALKPNFLVWPVLLILARHRKAGISALATFASVSLAPLAFGGGIQLYRQWIVACRHFSGIALTSNSSILAMFMRLDPYLGTTHYFRDIGFAVTVVFLLATAWCVFRKAPEARRTSEIALVASLLAGPVSWLGYTIVLIPMLYERRLNSLMRIGWVILCFPLFVVCWVALDTPTTFALLASPYFYGIVLIGAPLFYELYQKQESRLVHSEAAAPVSCHSRSFSEGVLEGS